MLELAEKHDFHFDTAQMPINVMDAHFRSFEKQVVPVLLRQGVALLGMKSMGDRDILNSKSVSPLECLQYALSRPTSVVITGIDSSRSSTGHFKRQQRITNYPMPTSQPF